MEGGRLGDGEEEAVEYHSKDFEWEELRQVVESDPSLSYHFSPFQSFSASACGDSEAWSNFHTRHSTGKFFKERRYLLKEFPELVTCADYSKILEVGCGNGSTLLPILRAKEKMVVFACDCSIEALERAKENLEHANIVRSEDRFHTFCCDFSTTRFPKWLACDLCPQSETTSSCCYLGSEIAEDNFVHKLSLKEEGSNCIGGVDFITLVFTLSAVPFQRMPMAIKECFSVLKRGGMLFFRDYGLYDMTMLRFQPEKRVGFREYVRNDGTRSYFFSLDVLRDLFVGSGFIELELDYCCIKSVNRQKGKCMRRVWVHGKFLKPMD